MNPYLEKVVPQGLAPTRSRTWEVESSQLFQAAFVSEESRPSKCETAEAFKVRHRSVSLTSLKNISWLSSTRIMNQFFDKS